MKTLTNVLVISISVLIIATVFAFSVSAVPATAPDTDPTKLTPGSNRVIFIKDAPRDAYYNYTGAPLAGNGSGSDANNPLAVKKHADFDSSVAYPKHHLMTAFYQATELLMDEGGTIVVCGPVYFGINESFGSGGSTRDVFTAIFGKNTIKITSVYNGVDYRETAGAKIILDYPAEIGICGQSIWENIDITTPSTNRIISFNNYATLVGKGVNCYPYDENFEGVAPNYVSLSGGHRYAKSSGENPTLTVLSGTYNCIVGGAWGVTSTSTMENANINLTLSGTTRVLGQIIGSVYQNMKFSGHVNITINDGIYECDINGVGPTGLLNNNGQVIIKINGGDFSCLWSINQASYGVQNYLPSFCAVDFTNWTGDILNLAFAYSVISDVPYLGLPNDITPDYLDSVLDEYFGPSYIDWGDCGDDLSWGLTENGTLYIFGTGNMYGYSYSNKSPWHSYSSQIKNVVIESGVTSIGSYAFYYCHNIQEVSIPSTVTKMGDSCFEDCESLRYLEIPYGVKSMPQYAFDGCTSLVSVNVPNTVQTFGSHCFEDCISLEYFIIPDGVTKIPYSMFWGCSYLEYIQIPKSVTAIDSLAFHECGSLSDIYYTGTKSEYEKIKVSSLNDYNEGLLYATVHYSSRIPCVTCNYGPYIKLDDLYHGRVCQNCEQQETQAHTWDFGSVTKEPTCAETGIKTYTCSVCNGTKTESIPKNDIHSYGGWSYQNDISHKKVCTLCGNENTDEHSWSNNKIDAACSECSVKRNEARPVKPVVTQITHNSITLMAFSGYEYSKDGTTWQTNNIFSGLSANTSYTLYQRIAPKTTTEENFPSEAVTVKTAKNPIDTSDNYSKLVSYLENNGTMTKYATGSNGLNATIQISKISSGVQFSISFTKTDSTRLDYRTYFVLTPDSTYISTYHSNSFYSSGRLIDSVSGTKSIDRSTYSSSKTYTFYKSGDYITSQDFSDTYNLCLEKLCEFSDGIVYNALGFGLKGLGFLAYSGLGNKVCDIPSSYHVGSEIRCKWEAGCTYDGYTGDKCCTGCNAVIEEGSAIQGVGEHTYTDACDSSCNICGETRNNVHSFSTDCDEECNICKLKRTSETEHTYDDKSDKDCNVCGTNRCKIGDLTGDDSINSLDGLLLLRHLNGWNVNVEYPGAMDVNGDGIVNSLDGLLLLRYLNGWDVKFAD